MNSEEFLDVKGLTHVPNNPEVSLRQLIDFLEMNSSNCLLIGFIS
jgi:hypothetical protein